MSTHSLTARGSDHDLPFFTQERGYNCAWEEYYLQQAKTHLDGITHGQTIICRQLFAGDVRALSQWKEGKHPSNDNTNYKRKVRSIFLKVSNKHFHTLPLKIPRNGSVDLLFNGALSKLGDWVERFEHPRSDLNVKRWLANSNKRGREFNANSVNTESYKLGFVVTGFAVGGNNTKKIGEQNEPSARIKRMYCRTANRGFGKKKHWVWSSQFSKTVL